MCLPGNANYPVVLVRANPGRYVYTFMFIKTLLCLQVFVMTKYLLLKAQQTEPLVYLQVIYTIILMHSLTLMLRGADSARSSLRRLFHNQ